MDPRQVQEREAFIVQQRVAQMLEGFLGAFHEHTQGLPIGPSQGRLFDGR
jgi:hypothetical protein